MDIPTMCVRSYILHDDVHRCGNENVFFPVDNAIFWRRFGTGISMCFCKRIRRGWLPIWTTHSYKRYFVIAGLRVSEFMHVESITFICRFIASLDNVNDLLLTNGSLLNVATERMKGIFTFSSLLGIFIRIVLLLMDLLHYNVSS